MYIAKDERARESLGIRVKRPQASNDMASLTGSTYGGHGVQNQMKVDVSNTMIASMGVLLEVWHSLNI